LFEPSLDPFYASLDALGHYLSRKRQSSLFCVLKQEYAYPA
jgi:hypothetical protein